MTATKRLRNDGGRIKVEYNGNDYYFEAGEEREVPADLADSAQYRFSHLGLLIVHPAPAPDPAPPRGTKLSDLRLAGDPAEAFAPELTAEPEAEITPVPEAQVAPVLGHKATPSPDAGPLTKRKK